MKVTTFILAVKASREIRDLDGLALVRSALVESADELRGPRGGRYVAVGAPYGFDDAMLADDYISDTRTFVARVDAKYVRPRR